MGVYILLQLMVMFTRVIVRVSSVSIVPVLYTHDVTLRADKVDNSRALIGGCIDFNTEIE